MIQIKNHCDEFEILGIFFEFSLFGFSPKTAGRLAPRRCSNPDWGPAGCPPLVEVGGVRVVSEVEARLVLTRGLFGLVRFGGGRGRDVSSTAVWNFYEIWKHLTSIIRIEFKKIHISMSKLKYSIRTDKNILISNI